MSVNVYLKDEIRQAEGFKMKQMSGGKPLQTWEEPTYNGIELSGRRQGRLYLEFRELEDKIPEVFNPFVEEVSYQESFAINSRRSIGIYRREKIVAELDTSEFNRERYTVKMRGSMEDMPTMLELYRAIRAGTISPLPGDSWEDGQLSRPRADIEKELEKIKAERDELLSITKELSAIANRDQKLREDLMETLHLVNKGYRDAMYLVGAIDKKLASGWSLTRRDPLRKYIVNRLRPILAEVEGLNLDEMVEELSKTAAAQ